MKKLKILSLTLVLCLIYTVNVHAAVPQDNNETEAVNAGSDPVEGPVPPPTVPINQGVPIVFALGVVFVYSKLQKQKQNVFINIWYIQ